MKNWNITIRGTAPVDGPGASYDTRTMASKVVEDLRTQGHTIEQATFDPGTGEPVDLLSLPAGETTGAGSSR